MKYKSHRYTILGILIAAFATLFFYFQVNNKSTAQKYDPKKNQKLFEVISAPLRMPLKTGFPNLQSKVVSETKTPEKTVPKWCQAQWDQLISQGAQQFIRYLEQNNNSDFLECFNFLPQATGVKSFIQSTCEFKDGHFIFEGTCPASVMFYRALLIDLNTKDDTNFSKMTLQILLNKILSRMLQGEEVYLKDRDQMQEMAKNIKEIEPNNPSTYKILSVVEIMTNPDGDILPLVQEGLRLDSQDLTLRDLWFYSQVKKKEFDVAEYSKSHPQDEVATYYYADDLWKTGQMDLARNMILDLARQHPENKRYSKTIENLKTARTEKDRPFFVDIPLSLENW